MSTGSFDQWQQVFTMSMLANGEANMTGKSSGRLQENLDRLIQYRLNDPEIQALIGSTWKIAWGPCVYQKTTWIGRSGVADNALFVAQNTANNTVVVAIAATNFHSFFDMLTEDTAVKPITPWPYGQTMPPGTTFPTGVAVAPGTSTGVSILQRLQFEGQSLATFLQSIQSTSATLVFTGHSLGAALAPTLACALITQGSLDPANWNNVYVYPTAGPTPGNGQFVTLFQTLFPQSAVGESPWQVWNSLLWNRLDVVPLAWNQTTMREIDTLYAPKVFPLLGTVTILQQLEERAKDQGYQQLPSNGALAGTFLPLHKITHSIGQRLTEPFFLEALYQHITAYYSLLGAPTLPEYLKAGEPTLSAQEVA